MIESLKSLISELQTEQFDLNTLVAKMLDEILAAEIEVKQPTNVRGVQQLLCAIHTYKV